MQQAQQAILSLLIAAHHSLAAYHSLAPQRLRLWLAPSWPAVLAARQSRLAPRHNDSFHVVQVHVITCVYDMSLHVCVITYT